MIKENKQRPQHAFAQSTSIERSDLKSPNDVKIGGQNADRSPSHTSVELQSYIKYKIATKEPHVYIMDCGAWVYGKHHFGLLCGSHAYIAKFDYDQPSQCGIVKTSNAKINDFFSDLPCVTIIDHVIGLPICDEDSEAVFCEPNRLYIFIPDIHSALGSRDPCDGAYDIYRENISRLAEFLSHCKRKDATIIQTGDLVDFWTVEASIDVYYIDAQSYKQVDHSLLKIPALTVFPILGLKPNAQIEYARPVRPVKINVAGLPLLPTTRLKLRHRDERLKLASDLIEKTLNTTEWKSVLSKIDYYIVGNHDWEITFDECTSLRDFIKQQGVNIHHAITPWTVIGSKVDVTHGHLIRNTKNDTYAASNHDSVMRVPGKPITFSYARYKRKESTLGSGSPLDPAESMEFLDQASKVATELVEGMSFDNWMDWIADWREFSMVRAGMLEEVLHTLKYDNSDAYQFKLDKADTDEVFDKRKEFHDNERTIMWSSTNIPLRPPQISKRIIIHSHTHTPQITRIKIAYDPLGFIPFFIV